MKIILSRLSWVILAVIAVSLPVGCGGGTATRKVTTGVSKKFGEKPKINIGVSRSVERKAGDKETTTSSEKEE